MTNDEVTKIFADRLQRFIPDRENAVGMAVALQEDIEENGYWIGGPHGIRIIMGGRLCPRCNNPLKSGDLVVYDKRRWWQFWTFPEIAHADCVD